jgi:hypothetical protein
MEEGSFTPHHLHDDGDDAATFSGIIENILTNNPWGCTPWESAGEAYTARIVYEDALGRVVGTAAARAPTLAGFTAAKTEILGNTALETPLN